VKDIERLSVSRISHN